MKLNLILFFLLLTIASEAQNVGIGTTSPETLLHLKNSTDPGFTLENTNSAAGGRRWELLSTAAGTTAAFRIIDRNNNQTRFGIDSSGRIGIGTNIPAALLDINGDARINGLPIGRGGSNVSSNVMFGGGALVSNTTGTGNISIGGFTLNQNSTGAENTASGFFALSSNTTGNSNTAFGSSSLSNFVSGDANAALGYFALGALSSGSYNTGLGYTNGPSGTGTNNSYFGALASSSSGLSGSSAIGYRSYVTQDNSLVLGAINGINGASSNTKIGIGTSSPSTQLHIKSATDIEVSLENSNTGSGGRRWVLASTSAGAATSFRITDATNGQTRFGIDSTGKIGIGTNTPQSMLDISGGDINVNGITVGTGGANSIFNTAMGGSALKINTTGVSNTSIGFFSMRNNTTGGSNTAVGSNALNGNISGSSNTGIGSGALIQLTTGDGNIGLGYSALSGLISGSNNIGIGNTALFNGTGNNNTVIGSFSKIADAVTGSVAIGYRSNVTQDNSVVLGSVNGANGATVNSKVGIGTTAPIAALDVNGGIRTSFSGTYTTTVNGGPTTFLIPVSNFTGDYQNTVVLVNSSTGVLGSVLQARMFSANLIQMSFNPMGAGSVTFSYAIFLL